MSGELLGGGCPYAYACHTWVPNRTAVSSTYTGAAITGVTTAYATPPLGGGVYVALSGQPLVAAGGFLMRMRMLAQPSGALAYSVDFPQLVGDQHNEFTMDVGLSDGVPCTPPAAVQSLSSVSETPGEITVCNSLRQSYCPYCPVCIVIMRVQVPPLDLDRVRLYNPATLSKGGVMWYAVNPSYSNADSFWRWCVTHVAEQQCVITSEYAPIRLWRVQASASAYCTTTTDGSRVCDANVAVGFALNDAMQVSNSFSESPQ